MRWSRRLTGSTSLRQVSLGRALLCQGFVWILQVYPRSSSLPQTQRNSCELWLCNHPRLKVALGHCRQDRVSLETSIETENVGSKSFGSCLRLVRSRVVPESAAFGHSGPFCASLMLLRYHS